MAWHRPIPFRFTSTSISNSFRVHDADEVGLPRGEHSGAFGVKRTHHTHEGVDLYCPAGTVVDAVEDGVVVAIIPFTGEIADPPSPWWHDTWAVLVEGASGVVLYGEIVATVEIGDVVPMGWTIGHVKQVLKEDKGRPMSMLHLELHKPGTRDAKEWVDTRPDSLLNPTPFLLELCE